MKGIIVLLIAAMCVMGFSSVANAALDNPASGSYLQITFVNQDPYPADTGGYINLLFTIENLGAKEAENVTFEIIPQYPFSLDPGISTVQELGTIPADSGTNSYLVKYKLKVDPDAVNGENDINVRCYYYDSDKYQILKTVNVTIENQKTDFDVVAQEQSTDSTTLGIANIGANTAYAVIIKIPEQESYKVTGVSANIVGNMDAGDYTLASFVLSSNPAAMRNMTSTGKNNLIVDISYTDGLGIRRTLEKVVSLGTDSNYTASQMTNAQNFTGYPMYDRQMSGKSSSYSLIYIGLGLAGIAVAGTVIFLKLRKRKKK